MQVVGDGRTREEKNYYRGSKAKDMKTNTKLSLASFLFVLFCSFVPFAGGLLVRLLAAATAAATLLLRTAAATTALLL